MNNDNSIDFIPICDISELSSKQQLSIRINTIDILLFYVDGEVYSILDNCSHDGAQFGEGHLDGFELVCPRHGARFDIRTGEVLTLPAIQDIPAFETRIIDGFIEIRIPAEYFE